jgi:hypothetical protein
MPGFLACGFLFARSSAKSVLNLLLLIAVFHFLSNLLCKHLFYNQAGLSKQNHFFIFQLSVLTTMPERSQAVPSRKNGDSRINVPSWVPRKTHASLVPQAQARPTRSPPVTGFQVPVQTWTPSSRIRGPASIRC